MTTPKAKTIVSWFDDANNGILADLKETETMIADILDSDASLTSDTRRLLKDVHERLDGFIDDIDALDETLK